jgi:PAS domain S-box-containing protein
VPARAPDGESARLGALYQLQLLDTPPDRACDGLVEVAGRCLAAPYAGLALVDIDRVWLKAASVVGGAREMGRDASLASAAVRAPGEIVVEPIHEGSPLAGHPAHQAAGGLAAMAAVAVAGPEGLPVGALEVGWHSPVFLSAEDEALLRSLAYHAAEVVSLVTEIGEYGRFVDLNPDAVAILDADGIVQRANPALARLVGRTMAEELVGRPFTSLLTPQDRSVATSQFARVLFGAGRTGTFDASLLHGDDRIVPCEVKVGHLGGAQEHVQVVVHDLTTRLRGEEERT